jgi:hypothetical protein
VKLDLDNILLAITLSICIGHLFSCQSSDDGEAVIVPIVQSSNEVEASIVENIEEIIPNEQCDFAIQKVKDIQAQEGSYEFHQLNYMFRPGGGIEGFYEGDSLVWLKCYHGAETGGSGSDFYLENNQVIAVFQYRDSYAQVDEGHWDAQKRTKGFERTIYLFKGDSICAEGSAIGIEQHGLHTLNSALHNFRLMREELDFNRAVEKDNISAN